MKKTYRYLVLCVLMLAGLLLTACNGQLPAGVEVKAAPDGKSAQVEFTGKVGDISLIW
jgi:predicted small secreted protein